MDKGNCAKCGHKIQKTTSDKCMYCGTQLEAGQIFTKDEKEKINLDKKLLKKELLEDEVERRRQRRQSSSNSIYLHVGDFGGGE
jgi:hypothetical protein